MLKNTSNINIACKIKLTEMKYMYKYLEREKICVKINKYLQKMIKMVQNNNKWTRI